MGEMIVRQPNVTEEDGWQVISVPLQYDERTYTVRFWVSDGPTSKDGAPFLALSLIPAMRRGADLRVELPVSPRLQATLPTIQDIFRTWYSDLSSISIKADPACPEKKADPEGVACFFSGGVDSFYSVIKNRKEITKLIYLQGFDIGLMDTELHSMIDPHIRDAAVELGIPLVVVRSDFHTEFSFHFSGEGEDWARWWGGYFHGAVLACVALLLAPQFKKVIIPSSHTYLELFPWGSHPLLDPLWSTETTEIVHDGAYATRVEKVRTLISSEIALRHLHVCGGNKDLLYNCGRCEKCLRTMLNLHLTGALDRCPVLPHKLDTEALSRMAVTNASVRGFIEENLKALEQRHGQDDDIIQALRTCLREGESTDNARVEDDGEVVALRQRLEEQERRVQDQESQIALLRRTVKGYESGKAVRVLLGLERMRQLVASRGRPR